MSKPEGEKFSSVYANRAVPNRDSHRLRRRLGGQLKTIENTISGGDELIEFVGAALDREIGANLVRPTAAYHISVFLDKCPLEDVLDSITAVYDAIHEYGHKAQAYEWHKFVARAFDEENLGYELTKHCAVRHRVDAEYEQNVDSLIAALSMPRFMAARVAFERARGELAAADPDVLNSTRSLFESAESLFKVITGSGAALTESEVRKTLASFVDRQMKGLDSVAISSAARMVTGFGAWVNACHPYRHGHDEKNAPEPPLALAVCLMSTGASYIRWLATLAEAPAQ